MTELNKLSLICQEMGISDFPKTELSVQELANLALTRDDLVLPIFAAYRPLALPIASEWVLGTSSSQCSSKIFVLLSTLLSHIRSLVPLVEHFLSLKPKLDLNNEDVLMAIIRLLNLEFYKFSKFFTALEFRDVASVEDKKLRVLGLAAYSLIIEASENQFNLWVQEYVGMDCLDFEFNAVLRECMRSSELASKLSGKVSPTNTDFENSLVTNVGGIFLPKHLDATINQAEDPSFVFTSSVHTNIEKFATSLSQSRPVLLSGPPGCGKTRLVEHVHKQVRGGDLVRIHLGEQTDAKSLIGVYSTGTVPGTFEWKAGALTKAVENGNWVLIEDIDKAPTDVASILLPLLDRGDLVVPSRNMVVHATLGFQIIATTTGNTDVIGARSWTATNLLEPSDADLEHLVSACMKRNHQHKSDKMNVDRLANNYVNVFRRIEEYQSTRRYTRKVGITDLLKLANRTGVHYDEADVFHECVACFASFLPEPEPIYELISDSLGIPSTQATTLLSRHVPQVHLKDLEISVGRGQIERRKMTAAANRKAESEIQNSKFALTRPTTCLLEEICVGVQHMEPMLLVGESGTGKTAVVQHLAALANRKLVVINVSQQVETGDLLGGYKPVELSQFAATVMEEFNELFDSTFSRAKNHEFIQVLETTYSKSQWKNMVKLWRQALKLVSKTGKQPTSEPQNKKVRSEVNAKNDDWDRFATNVSIFEQKLVAIESSETKNFPQFEFVAGLLVKALERGYWVLLDEINLAPADTVNGISQLLSSRSLTLLEAGGSVVHANPNFRLFANMNPATDVGKRDLPSSVRSQFTELWVPGPDNDLEALRSIVQGYLPPTTPGSCISDFAELFIECRKLANAHEVVDGAGQKPHFSMRTLSRTLVSAAKFSSLFPIRRALFEAFCMCFVTILDRKSAEILSKLADKKLISALPNRSSVMAQIPNMPNTLNANGQPPVRVGSWYISPGPNPVQEDAKYIITESVEQNLQAIARATSLKMFPILLQGPTSSGKTSMVHYMAALTGHKVVRINNHEHTDLAEYLGGYECDSEGKLCFKEGALVTALKNGDWLILDELNLAPTDVLEALNRLLDDNRELLVPETQEFVKPHPDFVLFATQNPSNGLYAGRKALSRAFRSRFLELNFDDIPINELEVILRERTKIAPSYASKIVEVYQNLARVRSGSRIFEQQATLRDLFRWAFRDADNYEELSANGFALLGERARSDNERQVIREILNDTLKAAPPSDEQVANQADPAVMAKASESIVWTSAMKRILSLVTSSFNHNEPLLLVGETGCGKTTIVQVLAEAKGVPLITVNAHQNTETGDLIGSQRPCRDKSSSKLFEWVDGPLVKAMKEGAIFLLDEISLADDSVLERLNSVLETERTLFVPEIGKITAADGFQFVATMNPGGDYGKKELSPALRNRFTEIWVPPALDSDDLKMIVENVLPGFEFNEVIVEFSLFIASLKLISLRDVLSWCDFISKTEKSIKMLVNGAYMVYIDSLKSANHKKAASDYLAQLAGDISGYTLVGDVRITDTNLEIGGFSTPRNPSNTNSKPTIFSLNAPTSAGNAMRVLRAMNTNKPILLEGPPGAGKTSLITAIASICNVQLARINLSEQTDLTDLFGQDVPLPEPNMFAWRNAPFLTAMETGHWVLLDEMNLAPQPVLEGLNACLDHRGEAYIPELDRTFKKHPNFRVFAAQNPQSQGGGRKGLPKSFVNRFSEVFVEQLSLADLQSITQSTHPTVPVEVRSTISNYIERIEVWSQTQLVPGHPFEFNLRDTLRWLDLIAANPDVCPTTFLDVIVLQRFRTSEDKQHAKLLFTQLWPQSSQMEFANPVHILPSKLQIGNATLPRGSKQLQHDPLSLFAHNQPQLESMMWCINQAWPVLLTGESGSGKTSLVRTLAQISGSKLQEFAITADIDSSDLLGEFDQMDREAEWQTLWTQIRSTVDCLNLESASLFDAINNQDLNAVTSLLKAQSNPSLATITALVSEFEAKNFDKPTFHWTDGMLINAVENGDWLVLDNANLCTPSVLDRLNSLMERGGYLVINECCDANGEPRVITPHPNFRLFLTVDPKHGELSRAMRNRSTEIWVDKPQINNLTSVSNCLSLRFGTPLTLARILDVKNKHWLSAYVLDPLSAKYAAVISEPFGDFVSHVHDFILPNGGFKNGINELFAQWNIYFWSKQVSNLLIWASSTTAEKNLKLIELSAIRRFRDSVSQNYDLLTVFEHAINCISVNPEICTYLPDLFSVTDESKIPYFRDWFYEYCERNQLPEFAKTISRCLGRHIDQSHGFAIEPIWKQFSQSYGFATKLEYKWFFKVNKACVKFDQIALQFSNTYATEIASIRATLVSLLGSNKITVEYMEVVERALLEFVNNAETTPQPKFITDSFKLLFYLLSLVAWNHPSDKLQQMLNNCSTYASLNSYDLANVSATHSELKAPEINGLSPLEFIIMTALEQTKLGQGTDELLLLKSIVLEHSSVWPATTDLDHLITSSTTHLNKAIEPVVSSDTHPWTAANTPLNLAVNLLSAYVPDLPADPAILQHILYSRYLRLVEELQNDQSSWQEIKLLFGSQATEIEEWLSSRTIKDEKVPDVWRPTTSSISLVHRDMLGSRELASSLQTNPRSTVEEITLALNNATSLAARLARQLEYRDLSCPVIIALRLVKISLQLQLYKITQQSSDLWLLDPVTAATTPLASTENPLLALRAITLSSNLQAQLPVLQDLLGTVYRDWTLKRLKLEEQQREETLGFRYDNDMDSEEAAEREFRMLFPDYDNTELELNFNAQNTDGDSAAQLMDIYIQIFSQSEASILNFLETVAEELAPVNGESNISHIPALYLALHSRCSKSEQTKSDLSLNFYIDPSPIESKLGVKFAIMVQTKAEEMLELWPEHDTLLTLQRVAKDVQEFPPAVPVALHLSKVEQMHHYLNEWDRYASKQYKVGDLMSEAASLVIRWRRLELASWPALFEVERRRSANKVSAFWFHLFETLIATPVENHSDIAKVLIIFMSEATYGEFEMRLNVLMAFKSHLNLVGSPIANCVLNVVKYYEQFKPTVNSNIAKLEKDLKKEVDDVVKLASWRDINIHALKQSAHRSHRQLFKVVKKFRSLLDSKAVDDECLPASPAASLTVPLVPAPRVALPQLPADRHAALQSSHAKDLPKPLQDCETTASLMEKYINTIATAKWPDMNELATETLAQAESLRNETPKTWSKENKKLITALKTQKQQLLTSVLRDLRACGLKPAVNKSTAKSQTELTKVLAELPVIPVFATTDSGDAYLYSLIDLLPRIRGAVSEAIHENRYDVPISDIQRGLAFAENMLASILKYRRSVAKSITDFNFVNCCRTLHTYCTSSLAGNLDPNTTKPQSLDLGNVTRLTLDVVKEVLTVSQTSLPSAIRSLESSVYTIQSMSEFDFRSSTITNKLASLRSSTEELADDLQTSPAGNLVLPLVNQLHQLISALQFSELPTTDIQNALQTFTSAANSILIVIQNAIKVTNEYMSPPEDDEWFVRGIEYMAKLCASIRTKEISQKVSTSLQTILCLPPTDLSRSLAAGLYTFVDKYTKLVDSITTECANLHLKSVSGSFKFYKLLFELAKSGFCSPQPTEDDSDEEQDKGDNAGLGDGAGADSTSKDVDEEDDDVAEAMQTENPDQQDRQEEDQEEDNAKDIEGDMAGQMEDAPPQDSDESEDDAEDAEDEVGDVDELDPTTLDEKMWDNDQQEDESKEKESNDVEGKSGEDLEANENQDESKPKDQSQDPTEDPAEMDSDNSAEDSGDEDLEQSEDVKNESEQLDPEVENKDALDLPEDMQLDQDEKDESMEDSGSEGEGEEPNPDDLDQMDARPTEPEQPEQAEQADDPEQGDDQNEAEAEAEGSEAENEAEAEDDTKQSDAEAEGEQQAEDNSDNEDGAMEIDQNEDLQPQGPNAAIEGVDGLEDQESKPEDDQKTSTDNKSQSQGQGSAEDAATEEANIGTGGSTGANNNEELPKDSDAANQTRESLKQLGDTLQEFHRRQREIKDHQDRSEEELEGMANDEDKVMDGTEDLEHVGAEDKHDTQALGKSTASEEQQKIDESLAIDDDQDIEGEVNNKHDDNADEEGAGGYGDGDVEHADEAEAEGEDDALITDMMGTGAQDMDVSDSEDTKYPEVAQSGPLATTNKDNIWGHYEARTLNLAMMLGEQLRLILEPTVASKLRGDYRTGKRLNMKRIIPYIASEFRKDKIWLRRTKPAKREYQILLALDDSKSMGEPKVVDLAFQAIALVGKALSTIEAGQLAVAKFGTTTEFVHQLNEPFTLESGNKVLQQFTFNQPRTDVHNLLDKSLEMFASNAGVSEQWKLEIIISDGITDDHSGLRKLVRRAYDEQVMLVFVVLDALNKDTSILDMNEVKYTTNEAGEMKIQVAKYMEEFPFPYYVIVRDITELPTILGAVLRQYLQAIDQ